MRAWGLWVLGLAVACTVAPSPETSPGGTIIGTANGANGTGGAGETGGGTAAGDAGATFDAGSTFDGGTGLDGGTTGSPRACAITVPDAGFALSSPCAPDEYCNAPGCQSGVCTPKLLGEPSSARNPQCGCDRVTYWNADVAAAAGASIAFEGACIATVECGGINSLHCAAPALCNLQQFSMSECNIADPLGTCWALPPRCPDPAANSFSHACTLNVCTDECSLIRSQALWYSDPSCPMPTP
jgi:hypothetical protein